MKHVNDSLVTSYMDESSLQIRRISNDIENSQITHIDNGDSDSIEVARVVKNEGNSNDE